MNADGPYNNKQTAREELEALSPLLAKATKPQVHMPNDAYFEALAGEVWPKIVLTKAPKRTFKLIPMGLASLAAAACIAAAIILWPSVGSNSNSITFASLTNDDLLQLALQDDALLENQVLQDDSLLFILAANHDFQYLNNTDGNDEYNKLLLEMIDDETLMEDWL